MAELNVIDRPLPTSPKNEADLDFVGVHTLLASTDNIEDLEIEEYEKIIRYYAKRRVNTVIGTDSKDKSLVVSKCLFTLAKKKINIFSKSNDENTPNNEIIRNTLINTLENNKVEVNLIITSNLVDTLLVDELLQEKMKGMSINLFRLDDTDGLSNRTHFITVDSSRYQEQEDIEDKTEIFNFNDPETTKQLDNNFSKILQHSVRVV